MFWVLSVAGLLACLGVLWGVARVWRAGLDWVGDRLGCTAQVLWAVLGAGLVAGLYQFVAALLGVYDARRLTWLLDEPGEAGRPEAAVLLAVLLAGLLGLALRADARAWRARRREVGRTDASAPRAGTPHAGALTGDASAEPPAEPRG